MKLDAQLLRKKGFEWLLHRRQCTPRADRTENLKFQVTYCCHPTDVVGRYLSTAMWNQQNHRPLPETLSESEIYLCDLE